jgi:hypothetical protein
LAGKGAQCHDDAGSCGGAHANDENGSMELYCTGAMLRRMETATGGSDELPSTADRAGLVRCAARWSSMGGQVVEQEKDLALWEKLPCTSLRTH